MNSLSSFSNSFNKGWEQFLASFGSVEQNSLENQVQEKEGSSVPVAAVLLESVPLEIFAQAFSYLNFNDLTSALTVCKSWHQSIVKWELDKEVTFKDLAKIQKKIDGLIKQKRGLIYPNSLSLSYLTELSNIKESKTESYQSIPLSQEINFYCNQLKNKVSHLIKNGHFQEIKKDLSNNHWSDSPLPINESKLLINGTNKNRIYQELVYKLALEGGLFKDYIDCAFISLHSHPHSTEKDLFYVLQILLEKIEDYYQYVDLISDPVNAKGLLDLMEYLEEQLIACSNHLISKQIKNFGLYSNSTNNQVDQKLLECFASFSVNFSINISLLNYFISLCSIVVEQDYWSQIDSKNRYCSRLMQTLQKKRQSHLAHSMQAVLTTEQQYPNPMIKELITTYKEDFLKIIEKCISQEEKEASYFNRSFSS